MHPSIHAARDPMKAAAIMAADRATLTYGELEARSNQSARLMRDLGLSRGDVVATLFDNGFEVFVIGGATQRIGVYQTSVSHRLSAADAAYVVRDCEARLLLASDRHAALALDAAASLGIPVFTWTDAATGAPAWTSRAGTMAASAVPHQSPGTDMLYSSGTTGRPKGVKFPLPDGTVEDATPLMRMGADLYGMGRDTVYLSTSPLYHAAPLRWAMAVQRLGGTVIVMERFDAEEALRLVERYRVTHGTFVPTHFVRMLRLPEKTRSAFDLTSLRAVIHAAAPCPPAVKRDMIDWLGPIVHEYYSGTEQCGITAISAAEWLERPGSVGRAVLGKLRITDDDGRTLPAGATGTVRFADGPAFAYHNDPAKTAAAHDRNGWPTLGDIGHVDEDGYLYLSDRKDFMIISGGVNIYPQEVENCLATHPEVADVAVIGVPDPEMGETVLAVVRPEAGVPPDEALAERLRTFARRHLGGVKTPRAFVFRDELPREATGKLLKRLLVEDYRPG